jgi:glucokinase
MTFALGIDLGGTNIKYVVNEISNGKITECINGSIPTEAVHGPAHVTERINSIVLRQISDFNFGHVGVAVPGIFNHEDGSIELFPNLPGPWKGFRLKHEIELVTKKKIALVNDARAFSLAESILGAGRGYKTVACLVLGTGVGGGIIIDGKIHGGANNGAGEIAHQIVLEDGPLCGCGTRGCVEALTSAQAISEMAGVSSPEEAFNKALTGDPKSLETFESVGKWLGIALANVNAVICPDIYVIGGGVAQSGDLLLDIIRRELMARNNLWSNDLIRVVPAQLGIFAGATGASLKAAIDAGAQLSFMSTT